MRHGYGATRGTPVGRQRASGSSAAIAALHELLGFGQQHDLLARQQARAMSPTGPRADPDARKVGACHSAAAAPDRSAVLVSAALSAPPLPAGDVAGACALVAQLAAPNRAAPQQPRSRPERAAREMRSWDQPPSVEERANTRVPSGNVTARAFAIFAPLRASEPSTVISSPSFSDVLDQPARFKIIRARELEVPVVDRAVGAFHVDVKARVRIRPLDFGDGALQRHGLVGVVLRSERMVRDRGIAADDERQRLRRTNRKAFIETSPSPRQIEESSQPAG